MRACESLQERAREGVCVREKVERRESVCAFAKRCPPRPPPWPPPPSHLRASPRQALDGSFKAMAVAVPGGSELLDQIPDADPVMLHEVSGARGHGEGAS
jgi:hypothetical protein